MARQHRKGPLPLPRKLLIAPGLLLLVAIILAVVGRAGIGAGVLLGAIGTWLALIGRHRRWKGAPEGGYVLIGFGVLIIVLAFFA